MKKSDESLAQGFEAATPQAPATPKPEITPQAIQDKEFTVARFGGYRMRDVDEFLDELTASMQRLSEENARLRAGGTAGAGGDADAVVARARQDADRIVADARRQAASISAGGPGGTGAGTEQDRAAIQAFLTRERAFLQSLAALVQEHVDTVKEMARQSTRPSPAAAEPNPAAAEPRPVAAEPSPAPADEPAQSPTPVDETIRVEEPEPASARRPEPSGGEAEGSLRELFWGEDE